MADRRVLLGGPYSADDRRTVRLLVKGPPPSAAGRMRFFLVTSLVMLVLSTGIWGAVYLLDSALLR
jgi:hypothetical protein